MVRASHIEAVRGRAHRRTKTWNECSKYSRGEPRACQITLHLSIVVCMTEVISKFAFGRTRRENILLVTLGITILGATIWFAIKFINPAPPGTIVIATGDGEGDYTRFAEQYQKAMKKEGVNLEIRKTRGAKENVSLLTGANSDVTVAFVHDGLITQEEAPDVVSLGSMYYEPLWIFANRKNGTARITRLSQLKGKTVSVGEEGSGTKSLALRLLTASGVDDKAARFVYLKWTEIQSQLDHGSIDAAFFIGPPEDEIIEQLLDDPAIELISLDNAEAMQRRLPFLHHLTLPHGAINLGRNLPDHDVDIVAPTATLLAKKSIHPALVHLLLRAATVAHSDAGVFEKANEFPSDKDFEIDLSEDARQFYKNGAPAWHRYLPFWLATLLERLLVIIVPFFAVILPLLKMIPRFFNWRARRKILGRYAELKFIEVQLHNDPSEKRLAIYRAELKKIEERVRQLKVPLEFADQLYGLRSNIALVHSQILQAAAGETPG